MKAVKRLFFLMVATAAGAVERVAGRLHQRAGIAYILSDIEAVSDEKKVVITFEDHANPDFVIVRGKRGKATIGFVASRSTANEVAEEITRMLDATEPNQ